VVAPQRREHRSFAVTPDFKAAATHGFLHHEERTNIQMNTATATDTLGKRLIYARELCELTTAQLARRAGVQSKTMSQWETGKSEPRANRIMNLAGVLNVSPAWLLSGHGEAPEETAVSADISHLRDELKHLNDLQKTMAEAITRMSGILSDLTEHRNA
jgi:transcriptional regulator with XRE-family HTH domain